jgi:prepilin-type N-terminal cleavage/methylation domain-containing protein
MKNQKGFSLIELLIVVAIIGIIAAIAIPSLIRARASANEAAAVGTLRSLASAEEVYKSRNKGKSGTFAQLIVPPVGATAPYIDADWVDGQERNSYTFNDTAVDHDEGDFAFSATPTGVTAGNRGFCVSADDTVRYLDGQAPPAPYAGTVLGS